MASARDDRLEQAVSELVTPVVSGPGAELVDVEVKGHTGSRVVKVIVDRPGGVDVEMCAHLSRDIGALLDDEDPIPGRYTLQVTSPGADRPLRTERDFARNVGRPVQVNRTSGAPVEGVLVAADAGTVTVEVGGETVPLDLEEIDHGRVRLPW
jgi:ribosome maturation factor RimP